MGNADWWGKYVSWMNPATIDELIAQIHIDGVLLGGASLDADKIARIANYQTPVPA